MKTCLIPFFLILPFFNILLDSVCFVMSYSHAAYSSLENWDCFNIFFGMSPFPARTMSKKLRRSEFFYSTLKMSSNSSMDEQHKKRQTFSMKKTQQLVEITTNEYQLDCSAQNRKKSGGLVRNDLKWAPTLNETEMKSAWNFKFFSLQVYFSILESF